MTTAYTSLLGLALPVTGELSGTWGDTVNNSITSLLDSAIAGTTTLSSDVDVTLTTTTGAANTAREAILLWTANGTVTRNITAPAQSKIYTVINASAGTQSIVLRGAGPTTGVTILKGESALCAWNGSDFIKISNTAGAGTFTSLTVSGATALNGNTTIGDAAADSLTVNATIGSNLIFTDNTYDIGASGATRPRNLYLGGLLTMGGALTVNGNVTFGDAAADTVTVNGTVASNLIFTDNTYDIGASGATRPRNLYLAGNQVTDGSTTLSGGTANGIAYLNGSKVLTTGTALKFDGQNIGLAATPSAWPSSRPTIEIGGTTQGSIAFNGSSSMLTNGGAIWFNGFFDGVNKYVGNGYANLLNIGGATNALSLVGTGTSGTAGATFSFAANNLLTITQGGKVGIQTNSPTYFLDVNSGATGFGVRNVDTNYSNFIAAGTQGSQYHMYSNAASKWIMSTRLDTIYGATAGSWLLWDDVNSKLRLAVEPTTGAFGVGVNPSNLWGSNTAAIQLGAGAFWQGRPGAPVVSEIGGNAYFDGSNWKRLTANSATILSFSESTATHPYVALQYAASSTANSTITWSTWLQGWDDGTVAINAAPATSNHYANLNVNGATGVYIYAQDTPADGGVGIKKVSTLLGGFYSLGDNSSLAFYTNKSGTDYQRMQIDSNGVISQPYQTYAYFKLSANITSYDCTSSNAVIKYDSSIANVGSCYNSSTGLFTAPVSGIYTVNASILSSGTNLNQIWGVLNGGRSETFTLSGSTTNDVVVGQGLFYLTAGDTLGFHAYSGTVSTTTLQQNTFHSWLKIIFLG